MENQRKERQFPLRLDPAGESICGDIKSFLQSKFMKLEPVNTYASLWSGSFELLIQSLWTMALIIMTDYRIDLDIWAAANSHSNWLGNRIPSQRINFGIAYTVGSISNHIYFLSYLLVKGYTHFNTVREPLAEIGSYRHSVWNFCRNEKLKSTLSYLHPLEEGYHNNWKGWLHHTSWRHSISIVFHTDRKSVP